MKNNHKTFWAIADLDITPDQFCTFLKRVYQIGPQRKQMWPASTGYTSMNFDCIFNQEIHYTTRRLIYKNFDRFGSFYIGNYINVEQNEALNNKRIQILCLEQFSQKEKERMINELETTNV